MANYFNEDIRDLLKDLKVVHESLVVKYLMKKYKDVLKNENAAKQVIYHAYRDRYCFLLENGYIAQSQFLKIDSDVIARNKAFRVFIEFYNPESESRSFMMSSFPWILTFVKGKYAMQVCHLPTNSELAITDTMCVKAMTPSEKDIIRRIAILDPSGDTSRIKKAGFLFYCVVTDDYKLVKVQKVTDCDIWEDVPNAK